MPTLTRLALGASAVSALTVFGAALPAAASTPHRATGTTRAAASWPATGAPATAHRATRARHAVPGTTGAARKAHDAYVGRVMRAITAMRQAEARADANRTATRTAQTRETTRHTTTHATSRHTTTSRTTGPTRQRAVGGRTSQNWSGYTQSAAELGRPVTSVSAAWQVPQARQQVRGQAGAASDWIGIGGTRSGAGRATSADPSLIQAGTTTTVGRAGVPSTYAWFETLPSAAVETPLSTRSGDRLRVAIDEVAANRWRVRLANVTTGRSWSTSVRYRSSGGSADFVSERPDLAGASAALPARSATSFRHATVDGSSTRFRPSQRVTMTDGARAVSTPSGAEGASGDGFSVCSYTTHCGAGSR